MAVSEACVADPGLADPSFERGEDALAEITGRTMRLAQAILAQQSRARAFGPQEALVDVGLSSLDLVNLMVSLEVEFDTLIPATQLSPKNFYSVDSIARMIAAVTARA